MGLKNFVLAVAIAILTFLVVVYGIHTFYPAPQYNSYCKDIRTTEFIDSKDRCDANNGYWTQYYTLAKTNETGYCDLTYYCSQDFNKAQENWNKNLFFFGLPLGIIIIIIGGFLFSLEFVGAGLMWGGVVTIFYSTIDFFMQSADWIKFTISIIALVIIIYFAYWYNKRLQTTKNEIENKVVPKKKKSFDKKAKRK